MSHYKAYPAYKDSGVEWLGAVPKDWEVKRLRYAASLNPPVKAGLKPDAEVSFLPMEAIGADGSISLENTRPIAEVRNGYSYFEDGDVTFAKVTPCFENGKGAVMRGLIGGIGFGTTELTVLRSNPHSDVSFINYLLQSDRFRLLGAGAMTGAGGLKRVPDEFTRNFEAPWPVLGEQQAISAHLDRETARIDGLVGKKTRFIELLREKRQALITRAVTKGLDPNVKMKDSGVEWLGEVPRHWVVGTIKRFFSVLDGKRIPLSSEERGGRSGEFPYYGASGIIDYIDEYIFDEDLILVSEDGANLVNRSTPIAFVATGKYWVNNHAHIIKPIDDCLLFWSERIEVIDLIPFITGSAQPKLTVEALLNLQIAVPPEKSERSQIEAYMLTNVKPIDTLISKTETSIALLRERRSALITAAVTGQIDLRDASAAQAVAPEYASA